MTDRRTRPFFCRLVLCLVALCSAVLVGTGPAVAEMCTLDPVPAASLLVPYFEVDLDNTVGVTTLFSVNNAGPVPALAHVTLWTDWSQPTVDFDMFLTGYDVIVVNLRDVFDGNIPITADEQSDPGDVISPHGSNPAWDGSFTDCDSFFPFYNNPVISGSNLERVVDGHTGNDVLGQGCMGSTYGDNVARGYVTVDSAVRCSIEFPSDEGYFGGLNPVADDRNVLWGDFFIVDPTNNFSVGGPLVHVEADPSFDADTSPSGYTFYGRYTQNDAGDDHREPLGSVWAADYALGPGTATDLLVWRDPTSNDTETFYTCGEGPSWTGLQTARVVCFNDEEDAAETCPSGDCLPLATQRTPVGEGELAIPYDFGWCWIDLGIDDADVATDVDFPAGGDSPLAQGWVGTFRSFSGLYAGGLSGTQLRSACSPYSNTGLLELQFTNGFESGNLLGWTVHSP